MASDVRVVFLGGLGEIGRNCACVEVDGRIMLLDCGLMFPTVDMPGVDLVLPDFTYLRQNADRIEGAIISHGHEDHTGGLSYLLRELSFPIYGSALSLGFARHRIEETGLLDRTELIPVKDGERRQIGPFDVEFIPVTHSVPNGFATAFHTPQGVILHTGDFKLDLQPIDGRLTDLGRMGAIASDSGIRLLLSDSTNAEEKGYSASESSVGEVLRDLFQANAGRRIITACFASHIHRIQQIVDAALATNRKVATLGRSMGKNLALAREMKLLNIPDAAIVDIEEVSKLDPAEVCVISTGSQGEPFSALTLMASGENRWLQVDENDVVILSSHPIPGNESSVGTVIDGLHRRGCDVIHSGLAEVHATGHAKQGELATVFNVTRPEYFIPVHGEFRHLLHHGRLAQRMGVAHDNVLLCEDGDVVKMTDKGIEYADKVPSGYLYVDGSVIGDVGLGVLRDRQVLAEEGVVVVIVTIDAKTGTSLTPPEVVTHGWVYEGSNEELLDDARALVAAKLEELALEPVVEIDRVRQQIRRAVGKFVNERTKRRPMIVPVVMEA